MVTAPMRRAVPTTAQAERIHRLVDQLVAQHPDDTELLSRLGRAILQQPDDEGPGLPEPVEVFVEQVLRRALGASPPQKRRMLEELRAAQP